jgi:hypothetical protein
MVQTITLYFIVETLNLGIELVPIHESTMNTLGVQFINEIFFR